MVNEELYQRLVDRYSPVDLLDLLDISIEQFVEALYDVIIVNRACMDEVGWVVEDEE